MRRIAQGVGGAVLAAVACGVLSAPLLMWTVGVAAAPDRRWMPAPPSLALVLVVAIACTGGCLLTGALLLARGPRALGAGVICGWLAAALATQGWAVGLAPTLYQPEHRYDTFVDHLTPLSRDEAERRTQAELQEALKLAGNKSTPIRREPLPGGCWLYANRRTGLTEPTGTGRVAFTTTVETPQGQALVDKVANEFSKGRHAVGRKHEATFENDDGIHTALMAGDANRGMTIKTQTPCLHLTS